MLELNGLSEAGSRATAWSAARPAAHAGNASRLKLAGPAPDRIPVLPGGIAIMSAVFKEFGLERMTFSEGALRLGVLYDLLGRYHHEDLRDATVSVHAALQGRSAPGGARGRHRRGPAAAAGPEAAPRASGRAVPGWAAKLHEIGISVAHSSYHKHSAYILANADMPGFSRQAGPGAACRASCWHHRGKLEGRLRGSS
jgi:exopolyphosphatase/guanosine-5'-triphosphate,3'-diphosphate pyrophosphatase